MKKIFPVVVLLCVLAIGGCQTTSRCVGDTAAGAGLGALAGLVVGVATGDPGLGASAGAVAGGAVANVTCD